MKVEARKDRNLENIRRGPRCYNQADVAIYVILALNDATKICNALIDMVASTMESTENVILYVRQEWSIFSNRCDHAVVCNSASNAPVFCVDTKYRFDETFHGEVTNYSLGVCMDQLRAMQFLGHPVPFGAITNFNETYFTSLSPDADWDTLPTLQSLQDIVARRPWNALPANNTPSSLTTESPISTSCISETTTTTTTSTSKFAAVVFTADTDRLVYRSNMIKQNELVSAFVIIILQAVRGFYIPKPFQHYTKDNQPIEVDCIQMTNKTFKWGKLRTTYKGPFTKYEDVNKAVYMIHCIGNGSTSKKYYAITEDGHDCVVKIIQLQDEDGLEYAKKEKENYSKIHGEELCIQLRQLNKFDCVILPYFEPIPIHERNRPIVQSSIQKRLQQLTIQKLAFHDSYYNWRNVGRYDNKIFLFNLGGLQQCENRDVAMTRATEHYNHLMENSTEDIELS